MREVIPNYCNCLVMETEGEKGKFEGLKGINKKTNIAYHVLGMLFPLHINFM